VQWFVFLVWLLGVILELKEREEEMDSSLMTMLEEKLGRDREQQQEGFWTGHSIFQVPVRILNYKGSVEALVLLYLYELANERSYYSEAEVPVLIEVPVKEEKIAERIGCSVRSVRLAIDVLDADRCIRVVHKRCPVTGRRQTSVYLLLHSQTAEPLLCSPRLYGVLHQNSDRPFITCPKETRDKMKGMQKPGRQTYLTALLLVSMKQSTVLTISSAAWRKESMLCKDAFFDGLRECKKAKLLRYERGKLTVLDPVTGEPSTRTKRTLTYTAETNWQLLKFADITEAQWAAIVQRLLKRELVVGSSGWTVAGVNDLCPFCHEPRGFRVHYGDAKYSCEECGSFGRLGQLVQRVLRVAQWELVRQYIRETIAQTTDGHKEI
jgi:hypothetical protein